MDLNLVVKVRSFFSLPDGGPKSWRQGKTLPTQMVDIDNYGLMQLVDFIDEHYMWGSKQYISLWRELDSGSTKIKSDENLRKWFQLNLDRGVVYINAQINDFEAHCSLHQQNVGLTLPLGTKQLQLNHPPLSHQQMREPHPQPIKREAAKPKEHNKMMVRV
jgi:hypothetical protein